MSRRYKIKNIVTWSKKVKHSLPNQKKAKNIT